MQFQTDNQFNLANTQYANQGSQFNIQNQMNADKFAATTQMQADQMIAGGNMRVQDMEYGRENDTLNRRAGEYQARKDDRAAAKGDLIGGIGGILSAAAPGLGSLIGGGSFGDGYKKG